jgi:hypothetical protein
MGRGRSVAERIARVLGKDRNPPARRRPRGLGGRRLAWTNTSKRQISSVALTQNSSAKSWCQVLSHGFCFTPHVAKMRAGFCVRRLNVAAMTASASLCAQLNHFAGRLVLNLMREELANVAELEKSRERGTRVPSLKLEGCLPV